ncbi:MAG TPA: hypothetical protein VH599_01305 [Ktedonobacterales bacterium]|jgi:hypothetical protein
MQISPRRIIRDLITNLRPRELFYWTIGNGVYWGFHLGMRVQLYGMAEHYGPPSLREGTLASAGPRRARGPRSRWSLARPFSATLVISTHKRDWDPILFAAYSYYHRGWLAPDGRRIGFAGRADIWDRGFLATVAGYRNWPTWAQRLLDATSFAPIASRMRAYPILRVPEYTLRQYFRALLKEEGDLPLSDVLSLEALLAFTRQEDALTRREKPQSEKRGHAAKEARALQLSDVLGWDYRLLTNRPIYAQYLTPIRYQRLREHLRETIDQQLERLSRSMETGDTLWFAPEGAVTLDGRVMRLRSGLHSLLDRMRPDVRCLPSNVTYDFMTSKRRIIACLAVGPELLGLRDLERAEQDQQVARALARQTTVTMSQLGSARLLALLERPPYQFDPQAEAPLLLAEARRLADLGAWVQRDLLKERGLRRRLRDFIAYAQAHHLIVSDQQGGYLVSAKTINNARSSRYWENPVRYCANELAALEAVLQPQAEVTGALQPTSS